MKIGIVCPYSFDFPGGVQFHIRDLAEQLIGLGHEVSVLAPADEETPVPDYVESAGRTVAVRYNGSVARLNFGPITARRVRRWLTAGNFDILHIHEPITPSLGMLALWIADGPIVATFHTANDRSRWMQVAFPLVRPAMEKILARIAVSEEARRTLIEHLGGDAVVIPNGVFVERFRSAEPTPAWQGTPERPTIAFLGRLDEPRKGLPILVDAIPRVVRQFPGARFLIAGRGDISWAQERLGADAGALEILGAVSDEEKASLLKSVDMYVAPHTGGESFGIVLVEAMSAGACVVSSNLSAFRQVLAGGEAGLIFPIGDSEALADVLVRACGDPDLRARVVKVADRFVDRFDWSQVVDRILDVYAMVAREAPGTVAVDRRSLRGPA
jgi:phosphatidylinositol alpha-mannosyltransferase